MSKRLVIWLIRKRLGLKPYEKFKFSNQKTQNVYYFDTKKCKVIKIVHGENYACYSQVSLNWLLSSKCKIEKM